MKAFGILILWIIWIAGIAQGVPRTFSPVKYQHFEDYLRNLDAKDQAWITGERTVLEDEDNPFPITFMNKKTKEQEEDNSCCILGRIAGDKGYHCYAKFYADRILLRNRNRAHNRKMAFHGHEKVVDYGQKIMKTFDHCVAGRGAIFHKCCRIAAMEKKSAPHYDFTRRWKEIQPQENVNIRIVDQTDVQFHEGANKKFVIGKLLRKIVKAVEYLLPTSET